MAVGYTAKGDSFAAGSLGYGRTGSPTDCAGSSTYDLAPDGRRLAAIVGRCQRREAPEHLTFLLNFFDELRRKAPEGKSTPMPLSARRQTRPLRNPLRHRRGRHGRSVQSPRHAARPHRRHQGAAGTHRQARRSARPLRTRSPRRRFAESPAHLHAPRHRPAATW